MPLFRTRSLALTLVCGLLVGACGGSGGHPASNSTSTQAAGTASQPSTPTTPTTGPPPAIDELAAAEHPQAAAFPPVQGRTLGQLARLVHSSAQFGAATGTFTPGTRRVAFALNTSAGAFIYAPTVVYIATSPDSHDVLGPFPAPADPTGVAPQYRSQQNAGPGGIQAIYGAELPLHRAGTFAVLTLTRTAHGLIGAPGEVAVAQSSPIPDVGQRPPDIATDTPSSVHGDLSLLTTRVPPDDMHALSFNQVLGRRPIALLFSTPQLCVSRVCGPVTDIAVSLEPEFSQRIVFIHEEVYVDNNPSKGLRPQMKAFQLENEP